MFDEIGHWISIRDGDPRAFALYQRHYSYRWNAYKSSRVYGHRNRFKIAGPSEYMLLITQACDALFLWVAPKTGMRRDGQEGINCAIFRNDSSVRSSLLILEAEELALQRWGKRRFYTYIDPAAIQSKIPGYCFRRAKWRKCGVSKRHKLVILEKLPL